MTLISPSSQMSTSQMRHHTCDPSNMRSSSIQSDIGRHVDPFPWNDMLSIPRHVWFLLPLASITMIYLHESTNQSIKFCLIGIFGGFLFFTLTSAPKTGHPNAIDCLFDWMFDQSNNHSKGRFFDQSSTVVVNQSVNQSTIKSTKRKTVSLKFSVKRLSFHVHHWCYLLIFYLIIYFHLHVYMQSSTFDLIGGFCLGGFVQGLKYDDWHRVVWVNQPLKLSTSAQLENWSDADCCSLSSDSDSGD